jgi:hypothetical protein
MWQCHSYLPGRSISLFILVTSPGNITQVSFQTTDSIKVFEPLPSGLNGLSEQVPEQAFDRVF